MKFGVVNKSLTVNRFVLHTLQRNITHLAVITRKTNIKLGILQGEGETGKEPLFHCAYYINLRGVKITLSPLSLFLSRSLSLSRALFLSYLSVCVCVCLCVRACEVRGF